MRRNVPMLEPELALVSARPECRAVASGINARDCGLQVLVDRHAVFQPHAGPRQPLDGRANPYSSDNQVRPERAAIAQGHAVVFDGLNGDPQPQLHAGLGIPRLGHTADFWCNCRSKRHVRCFDNCDIATTLRRGGCQLGSNPARPDYDELGSRLQALAKGQRIFSGAQYSLLVTSWQPDRQSSSRQHYGVRLVLSAVSSHYAFGQLDCGLGKPQVNIERVGVGPQTRIGYLSGQDPLRQWRPVIRRAHLSANERYRTGVSPGSQ